MAARAKPKTPRKTPSRKKSKRTADGANAAGVKTLVVDIGGTKVKLLITGETEPRRIASGKRLAPADMVEKIKALTRDWKYNVVSIGYPGPVGAHGPRSEPGNLGSGWVGFDFAAAFECPVRIINDAAMQALGSYDGGRMLFLGLGTGLGSSLIAENVIIPLELGKILYEGDKTLGELLGRRGLKVLGKTRWREIVDNVLHAFTHAFMVDYVVLGGGNAKLVKNPPPGVRLGHNLTAFRGGLRLWSLETIQTQSAGSMNEPKNGSPPHAWRVI